MIEMYSAMCTGQPFTPRVLTLDAHVGPGKHHTASATGKSMFEINPESGKPLLVVKASGLLRAGDYMERMPEFVKLVAETRPRGLLCDWTKLKGWDEEAESIRFFARLELHAKFERVAILADRAWDAEVSRLQEVTNLPIRRFPPSDRQSALAWLESNT